MKGKWILSKLKIENKILYQKYILNYINSEMS